MTPGTRQMKKICRNCGCAYEKRCKPCNAAYTAKYYLKHKDQVNAAIKKCKESNPEKYKESKAKWRIENHGKVKAAALKWFNANKKDHSEMRAKRHAANPEKYRLKRKEWASKNLDKLRIKSHNRRVLKRINGGLMSKNIIPKLMALQKGKCACCYLSLDNDFHIDHIIPVKMGGTNHDYNLQLLHSSCNLKKSYKHPIEFMQSRGFLL